MADLEYLYAVLDRLPRRWRAPALGVAGAPVIARRVEGLVAISSPLAAVPPATAAALAQHEEVVRALLDADALLPLPFGIAVSDAGPWVRSRLGVLREALERLRGSVEMRVRLLRLDARVPERALADLADQVVQSAALAPARCRAERRDLDTALAFLVPRTEVDRFLARIAPVAARAGGVAVVPSGPAPAWDFAPALGLPEHAAPEYAGRRPWSWACPESLWTRWSA